MHLPRLAYWLITGALLGFGLLELPGLGLIVFPAGIVLLGLGLLFLRRREMVAAVIGFGALPLAALINAIASWAPPCASAMRGLFPMQPLVPLPPCRGTVPVPPFYVSGLIVSGAISVAGIVATAVVWRVSNRHGR
ncbi:MAG TPA: hypothetical protein VJQ45_05845 [Ktedonobacterales bacterium]|nr:hypothetical protein [Ktedonobacterales bacterium]